MTTLKEDTLAYSQSANSSTLSEDENHKVVTIVNRSTKEQFKVIKDWTPEEERKAKRKVDFTVIPLLFFAFFILQMDRGNISNALTDNLTIDIGINTNQVNVGTALFNVGIVIFEIPANVVLQKIGPSKWLSFQVITWSLIATLQCKIKNYGGFLATRFLLGMFESGFIPGALFYLSTWYTKKELASRYTLYFVGNNLASACSGLIASGILRNVAGNGGLTGWQWIFIIEGVMGLGYGLIFSFLLPESSSKPRPFWAPKSFDFLTEREQYILHQRVILDDPEKSCNTSHITLTDVWTVFKTPHVWGHFIVSLSAMILPQAMGTYTPLIIKTMGYTAVEANARSSISSWMAIILLLICTFLSDRIKPRGSVIAFLGLWKLVFMIVLRCITTDTNATKKFAILTVLLTSGSASHILNTSWTSINSRTPAERSVSLALMVMAANIAGICGGQVLREGDRPLYKKGFLALTIVNAFSFVWIIALIIYFYWANSRLDKQSPPSLTPESALISDDRENNADAAKGSNLVVFVGKGDPSHDGEILESLKGEYHVVDKELEALQSLQLFRYTP